MYLCKGIQYLCDTLLMSYIIHIGECYRIKNSISIIVSISTFLSLAWRIFPADPPTFRMGICVLYFQNCTGIWMPPSGHLPQASVCHLSESLQVKISQKQSYCEITHWINFQYSNEILCTTFWEAANGILKNIMFLGLTSPKRATSMFSRWPALGRFRRPIKVLDKALMSQPRYTPRDYWIYFFQTQNFGIWGPDRPTKF